MLFQSILEGNALVVWRQNPGSQIDIFGNYYSIDDGWQSNISISNNTGNNASLYPWIALNNNNDGMIVWVNLNVTQPPAATVFASRFDTSTLAWQTKENISVNIADSSPYIFPLVAIDTIGNCFATWRENIGANIYNFFARRYDFASSSWLDKENISNNQNASAGQFGGSFSQALVFDTTNNAMTLWFEQNLEETETPFNMFARQWLFPSANLPNNDCTIIKNLVMNITTNQNTSIGIFGLSAFNEFAQNKASHCDNAYGAGIGNIQSGYTGSNFIYNVALPS
jgi:hypothetical protein